MKINEAIREAMTSQDIKFMDLANRTGLAKNTLANRINGERNISLNIVDELLHAIGYKMMIVPESVKPKSGWYEVESNKYSGEEEKEDKKDGK